MGRVEACWWGEWRLAGGESGGLLVGRVEACWWGEWRLAGGESGGLVPLVFCVTLSYSVVNQDQKRPPLG